VDLQAPNEHRMSVGKATTDSFRLQFFHDYLDSLCQAVDAGVRVKAYYAWSLMDK